MILLNLAQQIGLKLYRASGTQGGEYKSACPRCGGTDRFYMQPNKQMQKCIGYYRCRRCDSSGDAIQFAIDFMGMNFKKAAQLVDAIIPEKNLFFTVSNKPKFTPTQINSPVTLWKEKTHNLVEWAHNNIWDQKEILEMLSKRGLPAEAIRTYKIGWCQRDVWKNKQDWGVSLQDNSKNRLLIPGGIIIPSFEDNGKIQRVKIRRSDHKLHNSIAKYTALPGSANGLSIIGNPKKDLMLVVESELDAYAVHYAVGDYAFVVAVGSNIKNPDNITDFYAKKKHLLICHDNDEAGKKMYEKWQSLYNHAKPYPPHSAKILAKQLKKD